MPAERITRVARLRSIDQFRAHLRRIGADLPLADQPLTGASVQMPTEHGTFRHAPRAREERGEQGWLL